MTTTLTRAEKTTQSMLSTLESWFGTEIFSKTVKEKYYQICTKSTYIYFKKEFTRDSYMPVNALLFLRENDLILKIDPLVYSYKTEDFWIVEIPISSVQLSDISVILFLDKFKRYSCALNVSAEIAKSSLSTTLYVPILIESPADKSYRQQRFSKAQIVAHMMYSIKETTGLLDIRKRLDYDPISYPTDNPQLSYHSFDAPKNDLGITKDGLYADVIKPVLDTYAFIRDQGEENGLVCSFGKLNYYWLSVKVEQPHNALDKVLSMVREHVCRASLRFPGSYTDAENQILLESENLKEKCLLFLSIQKSIEKLRSSNGTGWLVLSAQNLRYYVSTWKLVVEEEEEKKEEYDTDLMNKLVRLIDSIQTC